MKKKDDNNQKREKEKKGKKKKKGKRGVKWDGEMKKANEIKEAKGTEVYYCQFSSRTMFCLIFWLVSLCVFLAFSTFCDISVSKNK